MDMLCAFFSIIIFESRYTKSIYSASENPHMRGNMSPIESVS